MRFKASQTTPSSLDRRLQLRMLSFVGLISVIAITLGVMQGRPAVAPDDANRMANSPGSSIYEVHREERSLPPDEFLSVPGAEDQGPRGQLAERDSSDPFRDDASKSDREPFQSRKHERTRDSGFFSRRSTTPDTVVDGSNTDERPQLNNDSEFEVDSRKVMPVKSHRNPDQTRTAPQTDDVWSPLSGSTSSTPFDEPRKPLRQDPSLADDRPIENENLDPPNDDPREPFRPNHSDNAPLDSMNPAIETGDGKIGREGRAPGRRFGNPPEGPTVDPYRAPSREDDRLNSEDSRERDGHWQPRTSDAEQTREAIAAVQIDKQFLDLVKDNTIGIRSDEAEVFYWLLDHARRVSSSSLDRAGLREVQYINLMTEPDRFRGEPITIEGDLWRLYEFEAGPNDYGVSRIYEGWVFTGDSGNHPYRIVCTSLPRGIEPGDNLRMPVKITGYFFKREGYRSNGGVHVAPTLLARRIGINPMPNGIPFAAGIIPYMIGLFMAVGLALLVTIVGFAIGDERTSRDGAQRLRRSSYLSFANLAIPTLVPIEESLRQFAAQEREAAVSGAYGPLLSRQTARELAVQDYTNPRQAEIDDSLRQHQKQTNVVHDWAARQKAAQAEIDALRGTNPFSPLAEFDDRDELNSSKLSPARNVLPQVESPEHSIRASESLTDPNPVNVRAPIASPQIVRETPVSSTAIISNPVPIATHHAVPVEMPRSNIEYRASKLAEWEEEVAKMSKPANGPGNRSSELSAAEEIERDRIAREQEIRERIRQSHAESDHLHTAQSDRGLMDHETVERETNHLRPHESHRTNDPHYSGDYSDRDQATFTLSSSKSSVNPAIEIEHDRSERERKTGEYHGREQFEPATKDEIDASTSESVTDKVDSGEENKVDFSSAWKRGRKRRRNWPHGDTA